VLAIAIAVLIAIWDWNWFRGPVARMASARMHREVTIAGNLKVQPWSWSPGATVEGVTVANPPWAPKDDLARIDRIAVRIRLIPLLTGHLELPLLEFDRPNVKLLRDGQGRTTWDFSDGAKPDEPLRMPPIRKFVIDQGQLRYDDARRKLSFAGTINASERLGAPNHGFELSGKGELNRQPFSVQITGGPLLNVDRNKPYPFDADIRAGQTTVSARGAVPKPFDFSQFSMLVSAKGQDLGDVYDLTGIALPNTPPYALHGRLSRELHLWKIDGVGGRVGSSDLGGAISVRTGGKRLFLKADLASRSLSFPDVGAVFGGTPAPGAVASPAQRAAAQKLKSEQRLFPDATLKVDRVRSLDADVTYKAASIRDAPIHLSAGSVHVKLDNGVLTADPVALDLPQGKVAGRLTLDARKATPVTDLDLRLSNARLEQLVPAHYQGTSPFAGALVGRLKMRGAGDSIHRALSDADGELLLVVPGGEVRKVFAELAGVNVVKGLGLLFAKDQTTTPIRCGVAHFRAKQGVLTSDKLLIDTGPTLVKGSGSINLQTERVDLRVQGHPKKFTPLHLAAPITVTGPILAPKPGVETGRALAQGGVAVAIGVVLSPLAAILPFIDAGLAKNTDCSALLAEGAGQGAPVASAKVASAKAPPAKVTRAR
jgi:hypothetical protein